LLGRPDLNSDFAWKLLLVLSILTMTLGNVAALWQTNLRRLLAYSSIAHAGYLMIGLAAAVGAAPDVTWGHDAVAAVLFYAGVYALATIAGFAALAYLSDDDQSFSTLGQLAGVGREYPLMGGVIAVSMFSLAGIPPLAGFWGKFALFRSVLDAALSADAQPNHWLLALCVIGVLNAAVAAAYYLRVVAALYFQPGEASGSSEPVLGNAGAGIAALTSALLVVAVGLLTGAAMNTAQTAAQGLWPTPAGAVSASESSEALPPAAGVPGDERGEPLAVIGPGAPYIARAGSN
jgi:NADH-quinone oxidoreductase subunit N